MLVRHKLDLCCAEKREDERMEEESVAPRRCGVED